MTKKVFANFFKKAIPVVGGVIGGGLTFVSFGPCCNKLKKTLEDTALSNPDHVDTDDEKKMFEDIQNGVIDVEAEEVTE